MRLQIVYDNFTFVGVATEWEELLRVIELMADTFEFERLLPAISRATRTLLNSTSAHIYLQEFGKRYYSLRTEGSTLLHLVGDEDPAPNEILLPLSNRAGERFGFLQVVRDPGETFNELERKRAALLAGLVAIAIKRQMLWNEARDKAKLEREMRRAHDMVVALTPSTPVAFSGYEFWGQLVPASLTGGDLYDVFPLDERRVVFLLADATGHGIDSTLLVAECRAVIRALFAMLSNPGRVMERANRLLCGPLGRQERFVTLFLGALDCHTHRLAYVNGGQSPVLLRRAKGSLRELSNSGLPLGVEPAARFTSRVVRMQTGDAILLATDGLVEWRRGDGEMYTDERLHEFFRQAAGLSASELVDAIFADAEAFAEKTRNQDDVAMFVVRRTG